MEQHLAYVRKLVEQGGPREEEYVSFDAWTVQVHQLIRSGQMSAPELAALREAFGDALSPATLAGFAYTKPHGYAGDYEIIDRIYRHHISSERRLVSWDQHWQTRPATKAVRNRRTYFHQLLDQHYAERQPLRVLKIASGPGRSMYDWLSAHPTAKAHFECIEIDPNAIRYAAELNRAFLDRITFVQKNALRYRPEATYPLIWAAGIFDYFNDRLFVSLVQRLLPAIGPGGELVVGNFAEGNPGRAYMELFDWVLHHRSPDDLIRLAMEAGVPRDRITIGSEAEGVNLFLHIAGPSRRLDIDISSIIEELVCGPDAVGAEAQSEREKR